MGYHTDFTGDFTITPALTPKHLAYLQAFTQARHIRQDSAVVACVPDPVRDAVGLPVGEHGEFYVGATDVSTQRTINTPHPSTPGLWCDWTPSDDGTRLLWNGNEKFYNYPEWLAYLITTFLIPWGYSVTGDVFWDGEDTHDTGILKVVDNTLTVYVAEVTYRER